MEGVIVIGGVSTGVIITFVVQLLKKFGLPDGYGGFAAAILSVAAYALYQVTQVFPAAAPAIIGVLQVIAFVAVTFGSAIITYVGVRRAELPGFRK